MVLLAKTAQVPNGKTKAGKLCVLESERQAKGLADSKCKLVLLLHFGPIPYDAGSTELPFPFASHVSIQVTAADLGMFEFAGASHFNSLFDALVRLVLGCHLGSPWEGAGIG